MNNEFLDLTRDQANTQYQKLSLSNAPKLGQNVMHNGHITSVKLTGRINLWVLLVDLVTGDHCMNAIDN